MINAEVAGTGMYVPEKRLTNQDLELMVDTSDDWIRARTGIIERRIVEEDQAASDLAVASCKQALVNARLTADEIEMIIVCTSTPDVLFPSTACYVQNKIGAGKSAAYDVSAVCSGFVFGLSIGEQYIKSGRYRNVLVVASEVNSRIVDWKDRSTCIIFGDGSGAVVLKQKEGDKQSGILSTHIYSDGNYSEMIGVPGGIGRKRISEEMVKNNLYVIKMDGGPTFKLAVRRMAEASLEALDHNGLTVNDIDLIVPHQANKRIIDAVGQKLNVSDEKIMINIDKYGNTSAASIPIALHEAQLSGRVKSGDLILLTVLGAGLTWGAALIRW